MAVTDTKTFRKGFRRPRQKQYIDMEANSPSLANIASPFPWLAASHGSQTSSPSSLSSSSSSSSLTSSTSWSLLSSSSAFNLYCEASGLSPHIPDNFVSQCKFAVDFSSFDVVFFGLFGLVVNFIGLLGNACSLMVLVKGKQRLAHLRALLRLKALSREK